MLDQLAVYKDQNNDKWFEKQWKMIENHAINEKKDNHNIKLGTKDQPKPKMGD